MEDKIFLDGGPPETVASCHRIAEQMNYFVQCARACVCETYEQRPVILLLNGHSSPTENTGAPDTAPENEIVMCFSQYYIKYIRLMLHVCSLLETTRVYPKVFGLSR
jgi:hypothetical protein